MLMIVLSHTGPYYGGSNVPGFVDFRFATTNLQNLIMIFYLYLGQLGNAIFLVCSFWFLIESKETKWNKVLHILADCQIISLSYLAVILLTGTNLTWQETLKQFFPTTFEYWWFVGCYLIVYAIHPLLNVLIDRISKKVLFSLCAAGVFLYSIVQMIIRNSFYYNRLVGFLLFYFLMAYFKKYMSATLSKKWLNTIILVVSSLGLIAMIVVANILGLYTDTFHSKMLDFCIFTNPFMILIAFSSFYLCKDLNGQSRFINFLASVTLYIYIFHENHLFANYVRPQFFSYVYQNHGYAHMALYATGFAALCYVASLILGLLYKYTLGRPVHFVCDKLICLLSKVGNKCYALIDRLN